MSGPPTSVSDAVGAIQRFIADCLFQWRSCPRRTDLQSFAIARLPIPAESVAAYSSRLRPSMMKDDLLLPHVSDNAHMSMNSSVDRWGNRIVRSSLGTSDSR